MYYLEAIMWLVIVIDVIGFIVLITMAIMLRRQKKQFKVFQKKKYPKVVDWKLDHSLKKTIGGRS